MIDIDRCDCGWPGDEELPHERFCAAVNSVNSDEQAAIAATVDGA